MRQLDVVDAVAAYRLTRLVTSDVITAPPRDRFIEGVYVAAGRAEQARDEVGRVGWTEYALHDDEAPKLATLVVCRWCASVWVGFGIVAARRLVPRAWRPVATALAFSAASALLARLEDV